MTKIYIRIYNLKQIFFIKNNIFLELGKFYREPKGNKDIKNNRKVSLIDRAIFLVVHRRNLQTFKREMISVDKKQKDSVNKITKNIHNYKKY